MIDRATLNIQMLLEVSGSFEKFLKVSRFFGSFWKFLEISKFGLETGISSRGLGVLVTAPPQVVTH